VPGALVIYMFYKFKSFVWCLVLGVWCLFLSGCAGQIATQAQLNGYFSQNNYPGAVKLIDESQKQYGNKNLLLYLLDKGAVDHFAGDYQQSIKDFTDARNRYDQLYTKSVSGIISTWLVNEYTAPYRGEDFERVMINIFQSLNYFMAGNLQDALVEARDVDGVLNLINSGYPADKKNVYREDGFARLLMGVFYESSKSNEDYNNAFISYAKAWDIYENEYQSDYALNAPNLLKENLLSAAQFMGGRDLKKYQEQFPGIQFVSLKEKAQKAEVYLIQYTGFSPVKEAITIPIPTLDSYIIQYSFPAYVRVEDPVNSSLLKAVNGSGNKFFAPSEVAQDVGAIAIKNLDNRKARVIAKGIISSTGKYLLERKEEENIQNKFGDGAALGFKILSSVFNVVSSQADLRCWRTLPSKIRISRLILDPGKYDFVVDSFDAYGNVLESRGLGGVELKAGDKKFFIARTAGHIR
jgi:hypothetical protein